MQFLRLLPVLFAFASVAAADIATYTEDGIDFTLNVDDSAVNMVIVELTMDTTSYSGAATDALHATGFKVFSGNQTPNATLLEAPGATADWFLKAGGANANTTHPLNNTTGPDSGFVTIIFDDPLGPPMSGATYTFKVKFNTTEDVLDQWSLKGITVFANTPGSKSVQWSSGDLTPGPGPGPGVPEPGLLLLMGLGAALVVRRARR